MNPQQEGQRPKEAGAPPLGNEQRPETPPGGGPQRGETVENTLPSLAEWIDCEVRFDESEKLHNYPIDVKVEDLKDIAIQTLKNLQDSKFISESQRLENIQKIEINEQASAHMGRVFLVETQFEDGTSVKFIVKASVDELRGKGGDLYSQCQAQELCKENGIRVPEVIVKPVLGKNTDKVFFMAEEYIEGRSASELSSEELQKLGFYKKFGEYLGRVHLIRDPNNSRVTAESLGRNAIHSIIGDKDQEIIPAKFTQQRIPNEKRLIHCDCHLGNVLITNDGEVVVIDWGAAKFDSPYAELQYLLIGSTKDKDTTHKLSRFPPDVAFLLSIPFGGAWEVIPREYLNTFLTGYTSVNQENIESIEDLDTPALNLKLLVHKSLELVEHAFWMKAFQPAQSDEEKSVQEHFMEMCLNTFKHAIKRFSKIISGEAPKLSKEHAEAAKKIGELALILSEKIPNNEVLNSLLEHERNQESLRTVDILRKSQAYDNQTVPNIFEELRKLKEQLYEFLIPISSKI